MMIDFDNLIKHLLPPHMRQRIRYNLLRALFSLDKHHAAFIAWRAEQSREANLIGQTGTIAGYLIYKYRDWDITITNRKSSGIAVGLIGEGEIYKVTVHRTVGAAPKVAVPLEDESSGDFGDADFVCYISIKTDPEKVKADIERLKAADKTFKIIQR